MIRKHVTIEQPVAAQALRWTTGQRRRQRRLGRLSLKARAKCGRGSGGAWTNVNVELRLHVSEGVYDVCITAADDGSDARRRRARLHAL